MSPATPERIALLTVKALIAFAGNSILGFYFANVKLLDLLTRDEDGVDSHSP